jgi:hypothetical protein
MNQTYGNIISTSNVRDRQAGRKRFLNNAELLLIAPDPATFPCAQDFCPHQRSTLILSSDVRCYLRVGARNAQGGRHREHTEERGRQFCFGLTSEFF